MSVPEASTGQPNLARAISPQLRLTLDIVRSLAALYVVVHHITIRLDPFPGDFMFKFGQEAVMAFFLLSGFVIHANERHRAATDAKGYLLRRGLRIYPTLICAMLLSMAVAWWDGTLAERFDASKAVCTLFALQDAGNLKPGTICSPFMANSPLWSLSYELVFYAIYPLLLPVFLRAPKRVSHGIGLATLVLIALYAFAPSHFFLLPAYFLVWWCGAMAAERFLHSDTPLDGPLIAFAYLFAATAAWGVVLWFEGLNELGTYPMLMVRHFGLALVMLALFLSPAGRWAAERLPLVGVSFWSWIAAASYGIYVFHFPLLIQWSVASTPVGFLAAIGLLLLLSDIGDRRMSIGMRKLMRARKQGALG